MFKSTKSRRGTKTAASLARRNLASNAAAAQDQGNRFIDQAQPMAQQLVAKAKDVAQKVNANVRRTVSKAGAFVQENKKEIGIAGGILAVVIFAVILAVMVHRHKNSY